MSTVPIRPPRIKYRDGDVCVLEDEKQRDLLEHDSPSFVVLPVQRPGVMFLPFLEGEPLLATAFLAKVEVRTRIGHRTLTHDGSFCIT